MKKPNCLREFLLASIPDLCPDQDRLLIFADKGSMRSMMTGSMSFEMSYTLDLILTDYAGEIDLLAFVLFKWISMYQPELMANHGKGKEGIIFEAEMIDNCKYDVNFQIKLTERVIATKNPDGTFSLTYPEEPQLTEYQLPTDMKIVDTNGQVLLSWTSKQKEGWSLDMPFPGRNP